VKAGVTHQEASLGVVVASCDKYHDTWKPLFDLFFKHWADCPYDVYLIANHRTYEDSRVTTLLAGDDKDWSSTVGNAISKLPHSHVLFWIDDAFPVARVDTAEVEALFRIFLQEKFAFLRLRPNPTPEKWLDGGIGELGTEAAYRVSLFATIWRVATLQQILRHGESAWQFELDGTERSRDVPGFYCTRKEVFHYLHGVEKGVWIRATALKLERMGYRIDRTYRPVMNVAQELRRRCRGIKGYVFHRIPERHRGAALKSVQHIYRLMHLR
jgi:hypothetical protein